MTLHHVMLTNKLYLDDRNNDYMYIVLCKLGSHTISGCRVTWVGPQEPPPRSWEAKKSPVWIGLKWASSIFRNAALMATRSRPASTYSVAPERITIRYSNSLLIIIKMFPSTTHFMKNCLFSVTVVSSLTIPFC